jgi:hypothetical protein
VAILFADIVETNHARADSVPKSRAYPIWRAGGRVF